MQRNADKATLLLALVTMTVDVFIQQKIRRFGQCAPTPVRDAPVGLRLKKTQHHMELFTKGSAQVHCHGTTTLIGQPACLHQRAPIVPLVVFLRKAPPNFTCHLAQHKSLAARCAIAHLE